MLRRMPGGSPSSSAVSVTMFKCILFSNLDPYLVRPLKKFTCSTGVEISMYSCDLHTRRESFWIVILLFNVHHVLHARVGTFVSI